MPLLTFNPPIGPSPGTPFRPIVSLNQVDFGDGYTQTSPKGINHIKQSADLRWEGLTEAQYIEIRDFFESHGGYIPFWYQLRGRAAPMKFRCVEWSGTDSTPWQFTAKLIQDFTPGA